MEIFKALNEQYEVSNYGRVKSLKRVKVKSNGGRQPVPECMLKLIDTKHYGYYVVTINGKMRYVHHLVAEVWLNHKANRKMHIDHIDFNPKNNHVDNLQITTIKENLTKDKPLPSSGYHGVYKHPAGLYCWSKSINGKVKHVFDNYKTAEQALKAKQSYEKAFKD